MRRAVAALLLATALCSCAALEPSSSSNHRYINRAQGYSLEQPETWEPLLVQGSIQFVSSDVKNRKHTIVVRAAAKRREIVEGVATTENHVVAATQSVLEALPGVKFGSSHALEGSQLPGARFSLSFVPRSVGTTYQREHAVLVGARRVFHVIYTAPAGDVIDGATFRAMVATLTEGV